MYESNDTYSNFNNFPYDSSAKQSADPYNTVSDETYYSAGGGTGTPEEPKKGSGLAKKLGTAAACALVFGAVAGVTCGHAEAGSGGGKQCCGRDGSERHEDGD